MTADSVYVALMRGINVGGKNKLPMADLVAAFERAGATDVKTYIQSGNVIFRATPVVAKSISATVHAEVQKRHAINSPVIIRTAGELASVTSRNPYPDAVSEPKTLHVFFLANAPKAAATARLDPERSPGDRFVVDDKDIFAHCPNGMARTKLTNAYFDRTLDTVSTGRNWNTVLKLQALAAE